MDSKPKLVWLKISEHFKNYFLFYIVAILLSVFFSRSFIVPRIIQEPPVNTVSEEREDIITDSESVTETPSETTEEVAQDSADVTVETVKDQLLEDLSVVPKKEVAKTSNYVMLKDVGEPYLDRFGLSPSDFNKIKAAGVDIIESNFDICASSSDVLQFLEGAKDAGLKVVMPAGSGEAEWGYPCDEIFSDTLKPSWQKEEVQAWVKKWSYHPAIYAWDTSNEDGQNFPNAERIGDNWAQEGYSLSAAQLQEAYRDVKASDPSRPVMVKMNGWFFYDYDSNFFRTGNAFGPNIADIVMVNAYSNVDEYFPDFVDTVVSRTDSAVRAVNPNIKTIVALGAWREPPIWVKPTIAQFNNDIAGAKRTKDILGIAIFKYGAEGSDEWWMPRDAAELWSKLKAGI